MNSCECLIGVATKRLDATDRDFPERTVSLANSELVEMMRVAYISQSAFPDTGMPLTRTHRGVIVVEKQGRAVTGKRRTSPSDRSSSAIGEEAPPVE